MLQREIGNSGIKASAVALGTWAIGGGPWWGDNDDSDSIKAIHAAIDAGISLIDTAPVYGYGHSEEVVGKAICDRREKVVLATKCGLWWNDQSGSLFFELDGRKVFRCLKPETIKVEIKESLRRLKTSYIDLYQTHWQAMPPVMTPIEDTMAALLELKAKGLIRAIGVSNVSVPELEKYLACGAVVSVQEKYSMLDRKIEDSGLLPFCVRNGVSALAYSPLEQGLLTGKIGMDKKLTADEFRNHIPWFKPENRAKVLAMLEGWKPLAAARSCTLSQLVIAWTLARPGVTFALCGARHPGHAVENAKAGSVSLSSSEIAKMDADLKAIGSPL